MTRTAQKPNFFIVGAQKTGTTALSEYLRTHPEVYVTDPKEPCYFDTDHHERPKSPEWYASLFSEVEHETAVGEASTRYLCSEEAAANISAYAPDAKIIVMLRNPVDLFHSLFHQYRFTGKETLADPRQAWEAQETRRQEEKGANQYILQYGDVCKLGDHLERVYAHFPPEQVFVIFFRDFKQDTPGIYKNVISFLGVSDDDREQFPVINNRRSTGIFFLDRVIQKLHSWKKKLGIKKSIGFAPFFERILFGRSKRPLDPALRRELTEYFRSDIEKLERLTGRDLSHWKTAA